MKTAYKRRCSCGEAHVTIYAKRLRGYLLKPLYELCRAGRGLTLNDIAEFGDDPTAVRRHWGELKLWRFIRKDGNRYYPTEHAKHFFILNTRAPDVIYTLNNVPVEPPADAIQPHYVLVSELAWPEFAPVSRSSDEYQPQLFPG